MMPPAQPFHQWQNFYNQQPSYGSDAYTNHEQLLVGVSGIAGQTKQAAENDIARDLLRSIDHNGMQAVRASDRNTAISKGISEQTRQQAANDIARDLLRAVDHNGASNMHSTERNAAILAANIERASALNASTTERVNSQLATAVERNGANNMSTTERVNGQLATAVERNGANGVYTTQLTAAQLATAVERNGANAMSTTERVNSQLATAVERTGAQNLSAIERSTGEARLTTVVTDAASRQFANDSARDITKNVDHYGMLNMGTTKDAQALLLGAIERNAGESRVQTLTSSGILGSALTDVRHSVLNDVNRTASSVIDTMTNGFNNAIKSTTDSAWEQRTAAAAGFSHLGEEHLRTKQDITKSVSDSYASMLLEQQKMGQYLASKEDNHFAMNQLEMQKVKEGLACQAATQHASSQLEAQKVSQFLASKADGHFAMNQLELHKVKESITAQAAQNFAANQLEQQKIREHLSNQLADAKYEQLKSQQFLADKLCECCCTIKEKVDSVKEHANVIDRDRLRDNLTVTRDEANMLKLNEYNQLYWNQNNGGGFGGFGGFGPWNGPWGGRGYGDGRAGYGNVYNNFDVDDRRRDDRRRDDRRRDDHHD
jgi:uncharacterized protein with PIN domain